MYPIKHVALAEQKKHQDNMEKQKTIKAFMSFLCPIIFIFLLFALNSHGHYDLH